MSKTLLPIFLVLAVACGVFGQNAMPMVEQNLIRSILNSGRSIEDNPQRSVECFGIYLPRINEATNKYEAEYNKCIQITANASEALENELALDRADVHYAADGICSSFKECQDAKDSIEFFECYNVAAGQAITSSYEIQTVSKNKSQYIAQKYQVIAYEQKVCTDTSSEAYVKETTALYAELDACLQGVPVITTTAPWEPAKTTKPTPSD